MLDGTNILKAAMDGDALYGDVYSEERTYNHIQVESGKIEKIEHGTDKGIGIRVISPWKTFYGSTNSFRESDLLGLAGELRKFSGNGGWKEPGEKNLMECRYPFTVADLPGRVGMDRKLAMVKRLESLARSLEQRVTQVRIVYRDTCQDVTIHNSEGVLIKDNRTQVILNILLVGEEKGEMQTAYEAVGGFYGFEYFTEELIDKLARKTAGRLTGLLEAIEAPMGTKTVVLASEAGGTMIHEAIGHGLESDLAMEGLSCYKEMMGQKIASSLINVIDDATLPHMRGTYCYDDEGTPSERTVLVENGVLKNYLFDRFHALKYGKSSTGNGRRESFRYRPIPRMSNTMILPGKDDPERIISSVDDGVLVVKMGGGQVDTVRGDFVFEISEGYVIEKGRVGPMIKNATMMGNGLKVLQGIDMVGNDLGFGIGTCGKDGQGVPVADAQPTLRIQEIVVGGKGAS
ncbi:MAG: TldD/PmbA family protein [Syntrophobacterales bacterium]|jgi:TldD protein|nr:TldD/PmbA family protein [Syntrophobacterales bacterium]